MTTHTHTEEQHASILIAQKQLIDHGDTKAASLLDWALAQPGPMTLGIDLANGSDVSSDVLMRDGKVIARRTSFSDGEPAPAESATWAEYVAGIIVAYLGGPVDDERIKPIAGIIARRLWALPKTEAEKARGYVAFGAGVYRIQQCVDASLVVSFRRANEHHYDVGDRAPEIDTTPVPANEIIVQLKFLSAEALDGLERQLRELRQEHWPETLTSQAALDVLAERQRHITVEGWTPAHDDEYMGGAMALAAASYAWAASGRSEGNPPLPPAFWPWGAEWWKPTDDRRNLVKGASLMLAEIERRDRAAQGGQG
ncbi:MAG: hypothetical protein EOP37_03375 [Rubrivivax sp.]|nr:MAG: hypothetical protein EOP37_03375 [Rubrivivax sp.]